MKFKVNCVASFNVAQFNKRLINLLKLLYIKAYIRALKKQQIY